MQRYIFFFKNPKFLTIFNTIVIIVFKTYCGLKKVQRAIGITTEDRI